MRNSRTGEQADEKDSRPCKGVCHGGDKDMSARLTQEEIRFLLGARDYEPLPTGLEGQPRRKGTEKELSAGLPDFLLCPEKKQLLPMLRKRFAVSVFWF